MDARRHRTQRLARGWRRVSKSFHGGDYSVGAVPAPSALSSIQTVFTLVNSRMP
jgi:hypothetical protein